MGGLSRRRDGGFSDYVIAVYRHRTLSASINWAIDVLRDRSKRGKTDPAVVYARDRIAGWQLEFEALDDALDYWDTA